MMGGFARAVDSWFERAPTWVLWCVGGLGLSVFIMGFVLVPSRHNFWLLAIVFVLFGIVLMLASVLSLVLRSSANSGPHDPELAFVWSVEKKGGVTTWRNKSVTDSTKFRRGGRFALALYVAMSMAAFVAYGAIAWNVVWNNGGLRASDLPSFIPVPLAVLLLLGIIARFAWNGLHDHLAFEVQYDSVRGEIRRVGLQPTKGIVHVSLRVTDVSRLSASVSNYKSATIIRVVAFDTSGRRHLLFGGLNPDDWARIGSVLLPPLRTVGAC